MSLYFPFEYKMIVKGSKNACYAFYGSTRFHAYKEITEEYGTYDAYCLKFHGDYQGFLDAYEHTIFQVPEDCPVPLPADPEAARRFGEETYSQYSVYSRSVIFDVEVLCNSTIMVSYLFDEDFVHYANGDDVPGECPDELRFEAPAEEDGLDGDDEPAPPKPEPRKSARTEDASDMTDVAKVGAHISESDDTRVTVNGDFSIAIPAGMTFSMDASEIFDDSVLMWIKTEKNAYYESICDGDWYFDLSSPGTAPQCLGIAAPTAVWKEKVPEYDSHDPFWTKQIMNQATRACEQIFRRGYTYRVIKQTEEIFVACEDSDTPNTNFVIGTTEALYQGQLAIVDTDDRDERRELADRWLGTIEKEPRKKAEMPPKKKAPARKRPVPKKEEVTITDVTEPMVIELTGTHLDGRGRRIEHVQPGDEVSLKIEGMLPLIINVMGKEGSIGLIEVAISKLLIPLLTEGKIASTAHVVEVTPLSKMPLKTRKSFVTIRIYPGTGEGAPEPHDSEPTVYPFIEHVAFELPAGYVLAEEENKEGKPAAMVKYMGKRELAERYFSCGVTYEERIDDGWGYTSEALLKVNATESGVVKQLRIPGPPDAVIWNSPHGIDGMPEMMMCGISVKVRVGKRGVLQMIDTLELNQNGKQTLELEAITYKRIYDVLRSIRVDGQGLRLDKITASTLRNTLGMTAAIGADTEQDPNFGQISDGSQHVVIQDDLFIPIPAGIRYSTDQTIIHSNRLLVAYKEEKNDYYLANATEGFNFNTPFAAPLCLTVMADVTPWEKVGFNNIDWSDPGTIQSMQTIAERVCEQLLSNVNGDECRIVKAEEKLVVCYGRNDTHDSMYVILTGKGVYNGQLWVNDQEDIEDCYAVMEDWLGRIELAARVQARSAVPAAKAEPMWTAAGGGEQVGARQHRSARYAPEAEETQTDGRGERVAALKQELTRQRGIANANKFALFAQGAAARKAAKQRIVEIEQELRSLGAL